MFSIRVHPEYQAKPGWSCELKGVHHVNCSFVRVAEPERDGVIHLVETGEANLRAVAQANPIRPRDTNEGGQSAGFDEACHRRGSNEQAPDGPSGVIGDSAQGQISRGTWETRQSGEGKPEPTTRGNP